MTPEEGKKRIHDLVLDIDRTPHDVCQPLLEQLIDQAMWIRDMREREMKDADNDGSNILPWTGKLFGTMSSTIH